MIVVNPTLPHAVYNPQVYSFNKQKPVKTQKHISFREQPWFLDTRMFGVPLYGNISAYDGINLYKQFACGNYLDIGDDKFNYNYCNSIRKSNLEFLDRITDYGEQKKFIDYYTNLTGFPNLYKVSENIKNEFKNAIRKTSNDLWYSKYGVVQAGYDGVCSVGRHKALPGSDIDKAYVIIKGTGNPQDDIEAVNIFKGGLWKNTDQRILSYNHDDAAFPQVYTEPQIKSLVAKTKTLIHDCDFSQEQQMWYYKENYIQANPYFLRLAKCFNKAGNDKVNVSYPSRENIKNLGFIMEAMREGEVFPEFGRITDSSILSSDIYKYTNLSQLHALKQHGDRKPKRLARDELAREFPVWDIPKQYRFVKTLIKSSCANNTEFTAEFSKYFSKPGQDLFAPLIREIMR